MVGVVRGGGGERGGKRIEMYIRSTGREIWLRRENVVALNFFLEV